MGYAFIYAIGLKTKASHLWSGKGIGFGSIGPGYSIDDSGIGSSMIYGSTQAGNVDLNPEAMV